MSSKTADSGAHGTVVKKFGKGQRQVPSAAERASKYYPAEDLRQLKQTRKTLRQTKLRPSLQPGTILILLAGRFRGKRVILLRHLDQGVLLITGPFKANGVPLRRVNARYVIATSQRVDLNGVDAKIIDKVSQDGYFTKDKQEGKSKSEEAFFKQGVKPEKKQVASARAEDQKNVDKALLATIKKTPHLLSYLHSTFSLRNGDKPHEMNF